MDMSAVTLTLFGFICILSTLTDATTEEPRVELLTKSNDVLLGSTVLLLCRANKVATFKWLKDGEDLEDNIDNEEEKSKLTLKHVKLSDSGNYTCLGDFDGEEHEQIISIYVYEGPSFGLTKTYHEFLVNDTAYVPCLVTGKPEVENNWYWNDIRVINNETNNLNVLPDGTLQITNIQRENHGTYVCEGKIKRRPIFRTLNISVVVNVPPTVIVRGENTKVVAGPKRSVSLTCLVTGAPHPNITWETPDTSDSSRYIYNSDKSKLTIPGVAREDSGKYVCTGANKIGNDSATFTLDVSEIPSVHLSKSEMVVKPGDSVSVFCNASGHPKPTIQWLNRSRKGGMSSTGRVRAVESQLQIENVVISDGGVYSCKVTNEAGSNTQNFMLMTSPGEPTSFTLSPGPSAFRITLQKPVLDGGSPITQYIIQWKNKSQEYWNEITIPYSGPMEVTSLEPYTEYFVRFAAKNKHFLGGFSNEGKIRTLAKEGEPDVPVVLADEGQIEKNTYSVPLKQLSNGGSPITSYVVRYRMRKEGEPWREKATDANSTSIHLQNLEYDTDYEAEIFAVNVNGFSKAEKVYFTIQQAPHSLGKGGVVAIVLVIFLLMLFGVDALCCYKNHCGMINFVAQKLFGPNMSETKSMEEGVFNNVAVNMNGLEKPRGSIPKLQPQNKTENGVQPDVTCDKAPLTKFEKKPANADSVNEARL
ncbi:neural cell adhesion molecule 1 [Tachysurus fulvidraco]|uniref:neural cell adhesion molecule 1 n=1 Tax=Tachysurus fulvidraco TaxID=1234273 RepID=UPI001FEFA972|nr:neural cell adhesion molecule 1 [Tachysurus fulvidraco]